ncbi:hypothetical protein GN956_G14682 [Arapaima gigas]
MGQCISGPYVPESESSHLQEWSRRAAHSRRRAATAFRRFWGRVTRGTRRAPSSDQGSEISDPYMLGLVSAAAPGLSDDASAGRSLEPGGETRAVQVQVHCEDWGTVDRSAGQAEATIHPAETTSPLRGAEGFRGCEVQGNEMTRRALDSDSQTQKDKDTQHTSKGLLEELYSVGELLCESSLGPVYEGTRTADGLPVAIKYVSKEGPLVWDMFVYKDPLPLEVAIMMRVSSPPVSPHILNAVEWFNQPTCFALVMERPPGTQELLELHAARGELAEDGARTVMWQVVKALRHCQERGVQYGVLDFRNLLVQPDTLEVKLIVYGCRRLEKDAAHQQFAGKELHLPPEVFLRNEYLPTPASVWSFGVTLYALVFGRLPFGTIGDIVTWNAPIVPGISDECLSLMTWCLRPKAANRPTLHQIELHPWFH